MDTTETTVDVQITARDEAILRFADKCLLPDDLQDKAPCWIWQGARHSTKRGYGKFWLDGKCMNAHKASYILFVGEVKEGQVIGHQCNNEFCVSPWHLKAETQRENMLYCVASGRHASQQK